MPKDANEIYKKRLREKLDSAVVAAIPTAISGDFETAEKMIRAIESDIYGCLAMARMYIAAIASLGSEHAASNDRELIRAMFERAVAHRERAYPTPHTQEEADRYSEGQSQDRGGVIDEIGFDPNQWPSTELDN